MIEGGVSGGLIVESERDGRPSAVGGWDANIVEVHEVGVGHEKRTNITSFEVVAVVPHAVLYVGVAFEHAKVLDLAPKASSRGERRDRVGKMSVDVDAGGGGFDSCRKFIAIGDGIEHRRVEHRPVSPSRREFDEEGDVAELVDDRKGAVLAAGELGWTRAMARYRYVAGVDHALGADAKPRVDCTADVGLVVVQLHLLKSVPRVLGGERRVVLDEGDPSADVR